MAYPLLDPHETTYISARRELCAMAIMAKAPRPGKVKTRLSPPLSLTETAALNICFLRDTASTIQATPGAAGLLCYTPVGEEAAFDTLLPEGFLLIPQRGDGFGERLVSAASDILQCGFGSVCLIDSDSPTVPAEAFAQAASELARPGDRVVLGASHDGGYYLIGLKRAHREPFENISWSTDKVAEQTRERCQHAGLDLVELPLWYDVDDASSLAILEDELLNDIRPPFATVNGSNAKATRDYLLSRTSDSARTSSALLSEPQVEANSTR